MLKRKEKAEFREKKARELWNLGSIALKITIVLLSVLTIWISTKLIKDLKVIAFLFTILKVISPIFIGLIIAWLFDPLVTWMSKYKIKRGFGALIIYLLLLGFIVLLGALIVPMFIEQMNELISHIPSTLNSVKGFIGEVFDHISKLSSYDLKGTESEVLKRIETFGLDLATNLPDVAINAMKNLVNGGVSIILGLVFGFYLLIDFNRLGRRISRAIPEEMKRDADDLTKRLNHSLRSFVQGTLLIMFLVFICQSIGFALAGLDAPLLFALFCAITNVIPYLGPYIGGIPAVVVGFAMNPMTGIFTLISIAVIQMVEGNILQPVVMGKTMKLHPVLIMVGLLIFQHLFGMLGMILATPIIATLKILVEFCIEKWHEKKEETKEELIKIDEQ